MNSSGRVMLTLVIVLIGQSILVAETNYNSASQPTVDKVLSAWKKREQIVRSFKFEWTEKRTIAKLSRTGEKGVRMPPEDETFAVLNKLAVDQEKMRFSYDGKAFAVDGTLQSQSSVSVFDGRVAAAFWPKGSAHYPMGTIGYAKSNANVTDVVVAPLLFCYRILHPMNKTFDAKRLKFIHRAVVKGSSCLVFRQVRPSGRLGPRHLYVTPDKDYSIIRYTIGKDGITELQLEIDYRKNEKHGWVPVAWKTVWTDFATGALRESSVSRVEAYKINVAIPIERFRLDFPPGTRVIDSREKSSRGDFTEYITKERGEKREILPEDVGASYQQLINSEPGKAFTVRPRPFYKSTVFVILIIGIVAIAGLFLLRQWLRKRSAK